MRPKRPITKRLARAFSASWREMKGSGEEQRAYYAGAAVNRLLMDFMTQSRAIDEEIRGDMRALRGRSRQLDKDCSYVRRYFKLLQNNVIGPAGMTVRGLVWDGTLLDTDTNDAIELAWERWANTRVTVDGKLTLRRLEKLLLKTMACDGEAFVRIWRGFPGNPFGFALQPIDADLIDETYNVVRQGARNEIRMGVELDALGRVVGYHVWDQPASSISFAMRTRYFVRAEDMIHLYDPERVNQTRGITWITTIMIPAHMLNAYEETEAIAARAAAGNCGFWVRKGGEAGEDLTKTKTPATMQVNPGTMQIGPDGYELSQFTPEHPTVQFPAFVKQLLRKIASGFSVFYNVLANDAEGVTYSTMRSFLLVERDDWRAIAHDFIDMWRRPLYDVWLLFALSMGQLALPMEARARYQVAHRLRGWAWIDPEKEITADVLAIQNGLASRTERLDARGRDIEEVYAEIARETALAKKYGIRIDGPTPAAAKKPEQAEDEAKPDDAGAGNGDRTAENRLLALSR